MISYDVNISPKALSQLGSYLAYIRYTLLNPRAAQLVYQDAQETRKQLERAAGSIQLCKNQKLHELGYRAISFNRHNYVMLYRIVDTTVFVDAVYHARQDYENTFAQDLD